MTEPVTYVYNLRWISEDTNPWDSNESCGMFSTFEKAAEAGMKFWTKHSSEDEVYKWLPLSGGVYVHPVGEAGWGGYEEGWYLTEVSDWDDEDREEVTHVGGDYGLHIVKEVLR